jgi:hypothetical protein
MKIIFKISTLFMLIMIFLTACRKTDENNVYSQYDVVDEGQKALIKFNYNVAFYNNPGVQIKLNGVRVSGSNISTRFPWPGGGLNTQGGNTGDYLPTNPGQLDVVISIPKRGTSIDSLEIYKTTLQTQAGKRYSLHLADTTVRKSLLVDEDASVPDSGFVRYRFVNLMPNVPSMDLYIGTLKVASAIPFMGISDSFTLTPSQANISAVWAIRAAGSATNIATYTGASTSFLNRRVYTVFANGWNGYPASPSTEPRRPFVSLYFVR